MPRHQFWAADLGSGVECGGGEDFSQRGIVDIKDMLRGGKEDSLLRITVAVTVEYEEMSRWGLQLYILLHDVRRVVYLVRSGSLPSVYQ